MESTKKIDKKTVAHSALANGIIPIDYSARTSCRVGRLISTRNCRREPQAPSLNGSALSVCHPSSGSAKIGCARPLVSPSCPTALPQQDMTVLAYWTADPDRIIEKVNKAQTGVYITPLGRSRRLCGRRLPKARRHKCRPFRRARHSRGAGLPSSIAMTLATRSAFSLRRTSPAD